MTSCLLINSSIQYSWLTWSPFQWPQSIIRAPFWHPGKQQTSRIHRVCLVAQLLLLRKNFIWNIYKYRVEDAVEESWLMFFFPSLSKLTSEKQTGQSVKLLIIYYSIWSGARANIHIYFSRLSPNSCFSLICSFRHNPNSCICLCVWGFISFKSFFLLHPFVIKFVI